MNDDQVQRLFEMVIGALERNTSAIDKVAEAVKADAVASDKMADQVKGLRAVITGAQRKIGDELGGVIDRGKAAAASLEKEATAVADSRKPKGKSGKA